MPEEQPRRTLSQRLNLSIEEHTFENYSIPPGHKFVYDAFYQFATADDKPFLGCYGGIGSGKTHLLEATSLKLYERGVFARIINSSEMFSALKSAMRQNAIPDYEVVLEKYCKANVLLIDDYGSGSIDSEWRNAILETLINHRYQYQLKTALITNIVFNDLPDRVLSRFMDKAISVLVVNNAADYRRVKK